MTIPEMAGVLRDDLGGIEPGNEEGAAVGGVEAVTRGEGGSVAGGKDEVEVALLGTVKIKLSISR